jgi:hypothetical protein
VADHPKVTMSAYRKFTDTLGENRIRGAPKPLNDPAADAGQTLGAVGTLGAAHPEDRNSSAAVTKERPPDGTRRQAESNIGDGANEHLNQLNHLKPQLSWGEGEEERAAIVEHDGCIPRGWAEGFARLHPARPPSDVPAKRWLRFVDDVGTFLDSPFCAVAAALGWGPHDLFDCDRDRPFARIDHAGLLWLLNGDKLIALSENTATIAARTGARQTWRRRPSELGRVLAWELAP